MELTYALIGVNLFGLLIIAVIFSIYLQRKALANYKEEGKEPDEFIAVLHNQFFVPMRHEEYWEWTSMEESERDRHVQNLRTKMMKKEVFYHQEEDMSIKLVNRQRAIELGIYDPRKKSKHGRNKANRG